MLQMLVSLIESSNNSASVMWCIFCSLTVATHTASGGVVCVCICVFMIVLWMGLRRTWKFRQLFQRRLAAPRHGRHVLHRQRASGIWMYMRHHTKDAVCIQALKMRTILCDPLFVVDVGRTCFGRHFCIILYHHIVNGSCLMSMTTKLFFQC